MTRLLYILAVANGVLGLGVLILMGEPLTAERAPLLTGRAVIVIAFVVVPYCTARALEGMAGQSAADSVNQLRELSTEWLHNVQQEQPTELFFDYFFLPGSDWQVFSTHDVEKDIATDDHNLRPS